MPRALIVKLGAIGDVLMAIPAAERLHAQGYVIDWVANRATASILALYPWIEVVPLDEPALMQGGRAARVRVVLGLWRRLARRRYDLAAVLYYDMRYRLLSAGIRARRKLQLSHTDRTLRLLPGRHHTDEYARILLGWPDEARPMPLAPVQPVSLPASPLARDARPRVVLVPGGARNLLSDDALRRWELARYVELAGRLLAAGIDVVLSGGPDDAWVLPAFAALPVADMVCKATLPKTLALFDQADVVVTHDTGPLHMAGVTGAGIVAVFGPTDPRGRLPQRPGAVALWGGEGFACRPCYDGHSFALCPANACMSQVTASMVFNEVITMLNERREGRLCAPRIVSPASTVHGVQQ